LLISSNRRIVISSIDTTPNKPPNMKTPTKSRKISHRIGASLRAGFSLVELLIVIAVIGIIAAIAIPNIGSVTGAAATARDQRNAQNIASVASSAKAAGYAFPEATGTACVGNLITGVTGPDIPNSSFKLDMDSADYTAGVKKYLNFATGTGFSYVKDGSGTAN
jgi:type IV pilus assembly protein PilA